MFISRGNVKRILEARKAGLGYNTISGIFEDEGINISASDVEVIERLYTEAGFDTKTLPKARIKEAIAFSEGKGCESLNGAIITA